MWRRVVTFLFVSLLVLSACSRNKEHLTLVIQWQKADTDACLACKNSGATENDIRKAFETLTKQLAAKGINVELVERKALVDTSKPEVGPGQMWLGDVPVETWLGANSQSQVCQACPTGLHGHGHLKKSFDLDGKAMDQIPVDLMVRAGVNAANHLIANGNIDSEKLSKGNNATPTPVSKTKAG